MKKVYSCILGAILALSFISSTSAAGPWGFQLSEVSSKINSCAGANVNSVVYISGANRSRFIYDEFFSKNRQAISDKSTRIRYWESANNLISGCTNQSTWQKYSDYSPGNWQRVVATGANCTFRKPTNKNNRNVQFVFNIGYYDITGGTWTPNPKFVYANLSQTYAGTYSTVNLNNIGLANKREHSNECLNIELRYCGDGIVSTGEGEICDPEDPLKRGWGNGGCNTNSCQPIETPVCRQLTVTPNSGDAPLNVTATCEGYKVNTFRIDCGNGQEFTKNGSNSGNESFSRVCNYTTAGNYTPRCYVNGNLSGNSCQKTVTVTNPVVPSIIVDKTDNNIFEIGGSLGDDTQTVNLGEDAIFKIRVTNNGGEALENITLSDPVEVSCATQANTFVNLSGASFTNVNNANVNISFGGAGIHSNNTLEAGEWFEYTCRKADTQAGYTNTVTTTGVGVTSGTTVTDNDPTVVLVPSVSGYDLALRKTLSSSTPGPFNRGDSVTFDITVFNQGAIDASNVEVTDYIPTGLTLNDSAWTLSGNRATRTISSLTAGTDTTLSITFTIDADAPRTIKNLAEISSDDGNDCDSTPDSDPANDGLIIDNDIGTGCNVGGDEDDHDPETIIVQDGTDLYDLALRKTLSSSTPGPFAIGDTVTFDIEVFNQGNVDALNIGVTDYIPTGLTLSDSAWTQAGSNATRVISSLLSNTSYTLSISFTINSSAGNSITNLAEISSDDGDDCDSTPDTNSTNDGTIIDNDIGTGCDVGGDEDDHDPETIVIGSVSSACTQLTASPQSAQNSLTSTLTCSGSGATTYRIEVRNSANTLLETINAANGSVTLSTVGTYTASCFVNNEATTPASCQQTLAVTSSSSSSSSSGGGDPKCTDIITNSAGNYTCWGNNRTRSITMRCGSDIDGNPVYLTPKSGSDITREVSGARTAQFSCSDSFPKCYVTDEDNKTTVGSITDWATSAACEIQTNPICGDGVVHPERGEQCDMGANNGKPGYACSATCTLGSSSSGGSSSSSGSSGTPTCDGCITTTPNGGELVFGPVGTVVVGHGQNPLDQTVKPYLFNNSDYDLSFDKFCIKRTVGSDKVGSQLVLKSSVASGEFCADIQNDMIYAYEKVTLDDYGITPVYTGNKEGIPSSKSYGEARLKTSIKKDGTSYYNSYLVADLDVRVAKPAITTVGGGTSYIKDSKTTGDVAKVTSGVSNFDDNKNFAGTSASDSKISSYGDSLDNTDDSGAITNIEDDKNTYDSKIDDATSVVSTPAATTVSGFDKFDRYNGLENVYIIKDKNLILGGLPAAGSSMELKGSTTYIIEGGDLKLTQNIDTNENIAFIVKGGDIIIDKSVTQLDGTYISIPVGSNGGNIKSTGGTDKQLVVNGSLYGDTTQLVDDRYYISEENGQLSVGTIVSFGSSIFHKPAPLLGQFVGEYLNSTKVSK